MAKFSIISIVGLVITTISAQAVVLDRESAVINSNAADVIIEDEFRNDAGSLLEAEEIKLLKNSYISPYHYLQDPVALNMGLDAKSKSADGTYHFGTSVVVGQNRPINRNNMTLNTDTAELWGQTGRYGGFAVGAGVNAIFNANNIGHIAAYDTTGQLAPIQGYVDYQYSNKVDVVAGNILITTPWVKSRSSAQGVNYAMANNSYQGALINVQALPSLLVTGYTAWSYLQYPNSWYGPTNFYNTTAGPLTNNQPTSGTSGIGVTWNPVNSYTGQLWLYNFADYANMAYIDNAYHVGLSKLVSMDFGFQALTQTAAGSSIPNQVMSPNKTTTLGSVSSNALGIKAALNIGNNLTSFSFNNIFGGNGSYLNGGMVSPYSYGLETDPLYTTTALTSLAEMGSGYAYAIRNTTSFMEQTLKFNLSMSQMFINQVYTTQTSQTTEYDAALIYNIPHTNMNVFTRLVYLQQPENYGGDVWQPRAIFNWTY